MTGLKTFGVIDPRAAKCVDSPGLSHHLLRSDGERNNKIPLE